MPDDLLEVRAEGTTLPYQFDREDETEGTASDSMTAGTMPTTIGESFWTGVRHRGVFDMFQRQDTMLVDANGGSVDEPVSELGSTADYYTLRRVSDGAVFPLPEGIACVVGRGRASDVRVSDDEHLSRRHARITCREDGATIVDLGSANGTWVGGKMILKDKPAILGYGEPFFLSKCEYVIERESI